MKKLFAACLLLSACAGGSFRNYSHYGHANHHMQQVDSMYWHGRILFRVFACEDFCSFRDTFPNPNIHQEFRSITPGLQPVDKKSNQ